MLQRLVCRQRCFFTLVGLACLIDQRPLGAIEPVTDYGTVELLRDTWGVPYVFAETDEGAMYGAGYAAAQDRSFQMYYTLRIIQGRLAEVVGDLPHARRERDSAVTSDRKMRTFGFARAAQQRVRELDRESVELLSAYAQGVNDYMTRNAGTLPEMFAKTGLDPEPWTPADCLLSWWHLAQFFATDGTRDLMAYRNLTRPQQNGGGRQMPPGRGVPGRGVPGQGRFPFPPPNLPTAPPDDSAAVVGRDDVTEQWLQRTEVFLEEHGYSSESAGALTPSEAGPKFSHAWVADGKYSGTSGAVLVSMPQTPVANPSLLYEFHLCGKTINARGVGVAGSPIILIGWNAHVAWGMTALGADQADLFRLKTDQEHPGQYAFDGQWRDIQTTNEEIKVRGGRSQTLEVGVTHWGPIVNEFAFAQRHDPLVALKRIPVCDSNYDTIQGALAMMRAKSVTEFMKGLAGWRFPTANVVCGDSQGNIGYSTVGALPLRSPLAVDAGRAAEDGTSAGSDWQTIIPQDLVPHVINPSEGYLLSGNHRPVGSFYHIPLGISTGSMGDTVRSWRLRQLLESKASMSPVELREMFLDSINPARQAIVRIALHMRDVLPAQLSPETQKALEQLEPWSAAGSRSDFQEPAAALAMLVNTQFRFVNTDLAYVYGGGDAGLTHFLKTVSQRLDEDPKAEISDVEREYIDRLLSDAWNTAQQQYGPEPDRWNEMAQKEVTGRVLPYYGSLDGFPSLDRDRDLPVPALRCVDGATIFSQAAQAYVQWVPLADVDSARSLLPPGPSEDSGSEMRTVNMANWQRGELHSAPLSRQAVANVMAGQQVLLPPEEQ